MIRMMATGAQEEVVEVGYFGAGQFIPCQELSAGMVGYITASIKNVKDTAVGDTITDSDNPCSEPLPGYKKVTSMVYCGLYPAWIHIIGKKFQMSPVRFLSGLLSIRDLTVEKDFKIVKIASAVF